jgi:hypothetical protein
VSKRFEFSASIVEILCGHDVTVDPTPNDAAGS